MGEATADVVVIGGGIVGCSIALALSRAGYRVHIVDQGPAAGAGSTSSSSAVIRFHYSTLDGVIASWESKHLWERWSEVVDGGDESGLARFHQVGALVIDPPDGVRTRQVLGLFDKVGVPYETWDANTIASRLPALDVGRYFPPKAVDDDAFWAGSNGALSAYFTPDAGFVDDPQLAAHNLMVAAKRAGAVFSFRSQVSGVAHDKGRVQGVRLANGETIASAVVVNAAGPYSSRVNEMAGVLDDFAEVSTRALRQEVHAVEGPPGFVLGDGAVVVNDSDLGTYFRPHPGGTVLVGGLEPECDPLVWVEDPDHFSQEVSVDAWQSQVFRLARRIPTLQVPNRPRGLAALYDVTPDWVPVYDRTSLDGFYVAIGTSGNQFKNAPIIGQLLERLIDACERGHDHDALPVRVPCAHSGHEVDLGHYSRRRTLAVTANNVLG